MKNLFLVLIIVTVILAVFPTAIHADEVTIEETTPIVDVSEMETTIPEEGVAEDATTTPEETEPVETEPAEPVEQGPTLSEEIVGYIKEHLEEISVIITLILTAFYNVKKNGILNKSIGTVNNNAVTVAENSQYAINQALTNMEGVASVVTGYREEIKKMIEEFRANAAEKQTLEELIAGYKTVIEKLLTECRANSEEKQKLEQTLTEVHAHLKTAKLANVELANEVAELLVLANIPNAKKEELYARHRAAVGALAEAEKTEAITNDGQKAE